MIELQRVSYRYADDAPLILDAMSTSAEEGSLTVWAGESGSGKTTLLRLMTGLAPWFRGGTASGSARVGGRDLATDHGDLADLVGFVSQDPEGGGVAERVLDEVAFTLENLGYPATRIRGAALDALALVGAHRLAERRLDQISGGERQRVAIASALAAQPTVLVLDEPLGQLDHAGANEVLTLLEAWKGQRTVVVAEHRLGDLSRLADRIETFPSVHIDVPTLTTQTDRAPHAEVRVRGLRVERAGREVVRDLDLYASAGTIVALRGPNGSGKSTVLRALVGGFADARGNLLVAGLDPRSRDRALGRRVGYLPQRVERIFSHDRVLDEVAFTFRSRGIRRSDARAHLASFGIEDLTDRSPRLLSAGQRLRVGLAAITAGDPSVLLLDEPTRGLDAQARAILAGVLRAHRARGGVAIIATHDDDLAALADQTIELESA